MIEIKCDRCGGIIREKYFTISINEEDFTSVKAYTLADCTMATPYSGYSQVDLLSTLNSRPIYCESCENEIAEFINRKP